MTGRQTSRPRLLPQNRRLRHLEAVYFRNIVLAQPRGQTIDDAILDKTPQKQRALRKSPIPHAQSSSDLRTEATRARRTSGGLGLVNAEARDRDLERLAEERTVDTFFTLHVAHQAEPIYISETAERATNPNYGHFDLSTCGSAISRLNTVTVKLWACRGAYLPIIQIEVNLSALQPIRSLERQEFPPNALVVRLCNGLYTITPVPQPPPLSKPRSSAAPLPTSSYTALMTLANLDESINDALATRRRLTEQIGTIIVDQEEVPSTQAQDSARLANKYLDTARKKLVASRQRLAELKAGLEARRVAIESSRTAQARLATDISSAQEKLHDCRLLHATTRQSMQAQRRRICEDILSIYPITPSSVPLLFQIRDLALPNSDFEACSSQEEDGIDAALGFVARVVDLLQYYLAVPLPYPVTPLGSRSSIHDPISQLADHQRHFPLHMRGAARFRFDYGVFLLNKDLDRLAESQGLKLLDIRQTLPNLLYLLYVCSAPGQGSLPGRKSGGVQGLLMLRGEDAVMAAAAAAGDKRSARSSREGSRRGSSGTNDGAEAVRKSLEFVMNQASTSPVSREANGLSMLKKKALPLAIAKGQNGTHGTNVVAAV